MIDYTPIAGIYRIRSLTTDKSYVGQSQFIRSRWFSHQKHLKQRIHTAKRMQLEYDQFGIDNFELTTLEVTGTDTNIFYREWYWQREYKSFDPVYGFNSRQEHQSLFTRSQNFSGYRHSPEVTNDIRLAITPEHIAKGQELKQLYERLQKCASHVSKEHFASMLRSSVIGIAGIMEFISNHEGATSTTQ